jgi:hypothetical protein
MTNEELMEMWLKDCVIDKNNIQNEVLEIGRLHYKYWKIYMEEKREHTLTEIRLKRRRKDIYNMYVDGATDEDRKRRGPEMIPQKKILKSEVSMYVDSDEEIIALTMKLSEIDSRIDALKSMIKAIDNRGWLISSHLKDRAFKYGTNDQ